MRTRLCLALCLVMLFAAPAMAHAAAPVVSGDLDVQVWPGAEEGASVVIISLTIPAETALPATVRVPVPEGLSIDWVGEIREGADPSLDPTRTYTLGEGDGGRYAQIELSESHTAQIEGTGAAPALSGSESSFSVRFVQTVPSDIVTFSVRLPAGVEPVSMEPEAVADPERNEVGETLFTLAAREMAPGEVQDIAVTYAPEGIGASSGLQAGQVVGILVAALALAALALVVVAGRQRRAA